MGKTINAFTAIASLAILAGCSISPIEHYGALRVGETVDAQQLKRDYTACQVLGDSVASESMGGFVSSAQPTEFGTYDSSGGDAALVQAAAQLLMLGVVAFIGQVENVDAHAQCMRDKGYRDYGH